MQSNTIIEIADKEGREHILPSDVEAALTRQSVRQVRLDVLEILSETTHVTVINAPLCAYIAWKGEFPSVDSLPEAKEKPKRPVRWFGINRMPASVHLGAGIGRGRDDGRPVLMLQLWWWLIVLGPHIPAPNE